MKHLALQIIIESLVATFSKPRFAGVSPAKSDAKFIFTPSDSDLVAA